MLSPDIPDIVDMLSVETLDRAELIAHIRYLERLRSVWECRVRVCEEKEQLWKNLLRDMGLILAGTFQNCHNAIIEQAEKAAELTERMAVIGRHVEEM